MDITRIYTDAQGGSHFEDFPLNMTENSVMGYFHKLKGNITGVYFQNILPHHEWDFMQAPSQIFFIICSGSIEMEVTDGKKKKFEQGDVICLDDIEGKGHKAKTFQSGAQVAIIYVE